MNSRGQASIEALFSLIAMIIFFSAMLTLCYFSYWRDQLYYISHEALVCREFNNAALCDARLNKQIAPLKKFGIIKKQRIYKSSNAQNFELEMSFNSWGLGKELKWKFSNQIQVPLVLK